jgi:hypothetical protein
VKRGKTIIPFIQERGWKNTKMFILLKKQEVGKKE